MHRQRDEPGSEGRGRLRSRRVPCVFGPAESVLAELPPARSVNMATRRPNDLDRMRALLAELPEQVGPGFRAGESLAEHALERTPLPILIVGMGGSGIAGELASVVLGGEGGLSLQVVRGPSLPRGLGRANVVVLSSYSGETWEVLHAYDEAGRLGAPRIVFAAGGQLLDHAERDRVPIFRLPPGRPPRTAVGSALGGFLGLFDAWLAKSNADRIAVTVERVRSHRDRFASPHGPAATLARALGRRTPIIYAGVELLPIARRWKAEVEENAKRLAMLDELPGAFHDAIVAWDALPRSDAARWGAILLTGSGTLRQLDQGCIYLERLARRKGAFARTVRLPGDDRLEYLLNGVVLGGYFSLFLAERLRSPPMVTDAIERFKAVFAAPAREREGRTGCRPLGTIPRPTVPD